MKEFYIFFLISLLYVGTGTKHVESVPHLFQINWKLERIQGREMEEWNVNVCLGFVVVSIINIPPLQLEKYPTLNSVSSPKVNVNI